MRQLIGTAVVQKMACRLFGAKPLSKPMGLLSIRNKVQWNVKQNTKLFIHENASQNIVCERQPFHYDDVIMTMLASQITSLTVVYSIVYSGVNLRKHQSSASLAFVWEIHRGPVNFPHKWPVTRKMFPFDDVIMLFGEDELRSVSGGRLTLQWPHHVCSSIKVTCRESKFTPRVFLWGIDNKQRIANCNVLCVHSVWPINSSTPWQSGRHFADDIFRCIFLNEKFCILIKISLKFVSKVPIDNISALVKIIRRRAIIWTNADPIHCRIYAALEGSELSVHVYTVLLSLFHFHILIISRPRENGRHFADIFKCIYSLKNDGMNSYSNFTTFVHNVSIDNISALVQIMAWRRTGDKPLSEPTMA